MAQASIAQREPSMEEILASIRRIIEDSDGGGRPSVGDAQARLQAEAANSQEASPDLEVFRHELRARQSAPAADMHDAEDEDYAAIEAAAGELAAEGEGEPMDEPAHGTGAGPRQPDIDGSSLWDIAPAPAPAAIGTAQPAISTRASIISEAAGRQVAAAFDELTVASFAASRTRSFDEMAEEMLRPMLQDWLDNNLPTMVERLVREEIERIARGGAR